MFRSDAPQVLVVPFRTKYWHNRHRDPKYRVERGRKMWPPAYLPDFDYMRKDSDKNRTLDPDQIRAKLKEKGVAPPNTWDEREVYSPSTMSLIEPYKPYEGDGKSSSILDKVKGPLSSGTKFVKSRRALSIIRTFEGEDFDLKDFAQKSKDIYIKAHEALLEKDEERIFDYVTEHCYPVMTAGLKQRTLIWKYLDEIELPQVVQVRVADLIAKGNKYAQITVRMHSKQIMAAYDRHGRLLLGSPTDVKEVLEYIVFEKYLANEYGLWRIHDRIRPESNQMRPEMKITREKVRVAEQ